MKNLLRTLIYDSQVSLTVADTTEMSKEGIQRHGLSLASAYVFAKALSAMTYMSSCLKEEKGEISLAIKSDGIGGDIAVSGNHALSLRGYIANTNAEGSADSLSERKVLGEQGALTVIRDDGYIRPFVGSCAFPEAGGLDEAFEEYYRISEQLPTRIRTAAIFDELGNCVFSGVVALQPLPFADEEVLKKVWEIDMDSLLSSLRKNGAESCVEQEFGKEETVWEARNANYKCNCSREYLKRVLVSLGEEQLREIIKEEGEVKVHCHYCNTDYKFTEEDADKLFPTQK